MRNKNAAHNTKHKTKKAIVVKGNYYIRIDWIEINKQYAYDNLAMH